MSNVDIAAAIEARTARQLDKAELTAVLTLEAIRRQVGGDIRALFDEQGHFRPIHTLPADVAALIASFEIVVKNAEAMGGTSGSDVTTA